MNLKRSFSPLRAYGISKYAQVSVHLQQEVSVTCDDAIFSSGVTATLPKHQYFG